MSTIRYNCEGTQFEIILPDHGRAHEWVNGQPGNDVLSVHPRMLAMLRTTTTESSVVLNVSPFYYMYENEFKVFTSDTINMTDYLPTTPNHARLVLVGLDMESNSLATVGGDEQFDSAETPPPLPTNLPTGFIPSALVKLRYNATSLLETDITDARIYVQANTTVNSVGEPAGYVLTSDGSGGVTWEPASGGNVWPKPGKVNIGDTEYDTIEAAIAAANYGEVVKIGEGEYTLTSDLTIIDDSISLIGISYQRTSISLENCNIIINAQDVTLSGLYISNYCDDRIAYGVYLSDGGYGNTISDCYLYAEGYGYAGYGVYQKSTTGNNTAVKIINTIIAATSDSDSYAFYQEDSVSYEAVAELLGGEFLADTTAIHAESNNASSEIEIRGGAKIDDGVSGTAIVGRYDNTDGTENVDKFQFNLAPTQTDGEGSLMWDSDNGTLSLGMPGGDVRIQLGQELVFRAKCDDVGDISNGATVYVSDATGGVPLVKAITGTSDFDIAHRVFGVATEDITYNQMGYITFFGLVRDINTSGLTEGEPVYIDTDGSYTNTPPVAPNAQIFVGITLREHATEGVMGVNPHTTHRIQDLSGVSVSSVADKDSLTWNETSGYWENTQEPAWEHVNMMSGRLWGGFITDNGDGSVTVSAGQGLIKADDAGPEDVPTSLMQGQGSELSLVSWSENASVSCTDNAYNYLYYDGSSGTLQSTTDFYSISFTQDFTVGRVYRDGTTITIRLCGTNLWNFDRRVQLFGEEVFPVVKAFGVIPSETGTRNLAVTAGVLWAELVNRFSIAAMDTSATDTFSYWYRDGGGGWTEVASQTQIDNAYWDDNTGTLNTLTSNRYGVHWLYMVHDNSLHVVYGQGDYTETQSELATPPATLPGLLEAYSTIIGKVVIQEGEATFHSIETPDETTFSSSGVSNHNDLAGLQGGTTSEYYHLTSDERDGILGFPPPGKIIVDGETVHDSWDSLSSIIGDGDIQVLVGKGVFASTTRYNFLGRLLAGMGQDSTVLNLTTSSNGINIYGDEGVLIRDLTFLDEALDVADSYVYISGTSGVVGEFVVFEDVNIETISSGATSQIIALNIANDCQNVVKLVNCRISATGTTDNYAIYNAGGYYQVEMYGGEYYGDIETTANDLYLYGPKIYGNIIDSTGSNVHGYYIDINDKLVSIDGIDYDNITSGLTATDVQAAIDEVISTRGTLATQNEVTASDIDAEASTSGQVLISDGVGSAAWGDQSGGGGSGDVVGPSSATDNAIARFDTTTGKLIQNSGVTIDDSNNITTPGTVDGRDVSTDGSKLDGVEAGATADQTASEILTAIKTVDGSGSGLDADTLDGYDMSAEYGPSAVGNFGQWQAHGTYTDFNTEPAYWGWNYISSYTNAPNTTSSQWYRGRFSLGYYYGKGSNSGDYWLEIAIPRYNQSTAGVWTRTCESGSIGGWTQVGGSSGDMTPSEILTAIKTVDGSGSGLDADTLDTIDSSRIVSGKNSTKTERITDFNVALPSGFYDGYKTTGSPTATWYHLINSRHTNEGNSYQFQIAQEFWNNANTFYRIITDGSIGSWNRIWHSGNDGSGSGLDADKLDSYNQTDASTGNTIVRRNSSGDIKARLFRSEYDSTNSNINYVMTQIDTAGNNYIRPSTISQLKTALGAAPQNGVIVGKTSNQTYYRNTFTNVSFNTYYQNPNSLNWLGGNAITVDAPGWYGISVQAHLECSDTSRIDVLQILVNGATIFDKRETWNAGWTGSYMSANFILYLSSGDEITLRTYLGGAGSNGTIESDFTRLGVVKL